MGKRVKVFTASGTFRGEQGEVTEYTRDGAYVRVEGDSHPMHFSRGELVRLDEEHHAGAE